MVVGGAIPAPREACCVDSKVRDICIQPSYNGPLSSRGFTTKEPKPRKDYLLALPGCFTLQESWAYFAKTRDLRLRGKQQVALRPQTNL